MPMIELVFERVDAMALWYNAECQANHLLARSGIALVMQSIFADFESASAMHIGRLDHVCWISSSLTDTIPQIPCI